MLSHARHDGRIRDLKAAEPADEHLYVEPTFRPRGNPKLREVRRFMHVQADATQSENSFPKSHGRNHRFKSHNISTGQLFKHTHTTTHLTKPRPNEPMGRRSAKASSLPPKPPTSGPNGVDKHRSESRKDRTFIGGRCAACEESLEHKLSGEKVVQFSCGHPVHEECLYELIKGEEDEEQFCPECNAPLELDSSRGGNILDLNKLGDMVRSISQPPDELSQARPSSNVAKDWDGSSFRDSSASSRQSTSSLRDSIAEDQQGSISRTEKLAGSSHPLRQETNITDTPLVEEPSAEAQTYDDNLSIMESKAKQVDPMQNIPRPKVTIRSEFPTLTRTNQQQSITCLVTVEVPTSRTRSHRISRPRLLPPAPRLTTETPEALEEIATDLKERVENWHGLETDKFGPLRLHNNLKVGRDGKTWQKLDCFLFADLLICIREKRATQPAIPGTKPRCQLKGSILIRQHLTDVSSSPDELILTLSLSVASLPTFRLKFTSREQLDVWRLGLMQLGPSAASLYAAAEEQGDSEDEDDASYRSRRDRPTSISSSTHSSSSTGSTVPTDYGDSASANQGIAPNIHVPFDLVVVIPVSSAVQGLKIKLLKDALRFIITHLGEHDRMGLVTFGANGGANPLVSMSSKDWYGWRGVYRSIRPVGQKALRPDPVDGANIALDLLAQRTNPNPISSILLISDSPSNEVDKVDSVVKRAHKAHVSINAFGLGQTHKPDSLIELSSRTNASYLYVKDWMMLRECVAGCLGSLLSTTHTAAKLKLKIPEGSIAKFVKVSGALHATRKSSGRDAEAVLGDLRFGDRRDVLVQLSVDASSSASDGGPHDHWESLVSGLTGSQDEGSQEPPSVQEVPLIQADLSYGDFEKNGATAHLSHPSLLTITLLPEDRKAKRGSRGSIIPPIPSHPSIVQRRMEMLTSDMLTRALTLASKGQHDSAHTLLSETQMVLQGLGKGSLPALPAGAASKSGNNRSTSTPKSSRASSREGRSTPKSGRESPRVPQTSSGRASPQVTEERRNSSHRLSAHFNDTITRSASTIDSKLLHALTTDILACVEFIDQPAIFSHDAKKAALQTIGLISSQRGYTFRTETESYWAARISGIKNMGEIVRDWQMVGNDTLAEDTLAEES